MWAHCNKDCNDHAHIQAHGLTGVTPQKGNHAQLQTNQLTFVTLSKASLAPGRSPTLSGWTSKDLDRLARRIVSSPAVGSTSSTE